MLKINFKGREIPCKQGDNLRKVLRQANLTPHNSEANWLNCKGMGTCGTCAIRVDGKVSPITAVEKWRLNFPPHKMENGLRLACQCTVLSDLKIEKYEGFWGQNITI
jgi:ferredoxin